MDRAVWASLDGGRMSTFSAHTSRGASRRIVLAVIALSIAAPQLSFVTPGESFDPEQLEGRAPTAQELEPAIQAAFPQQSYAPGNAASLVFFNSGRGVTLQILHSGPEGTPTRMYDVVHGVPVTNRIWVGDVQPGRGLPPPSRRLAQRRLLRSPPATDGRSASPRSCSVRAGSVSTTSPS